MVHRKGHYRKMKIRSKRARKIAGASYKRVWVDGHPMRKPR